MDNSLYHFVPRWMTDYLKNRCCSKCGERIRKRNIVAIGIRQIKSTCVVSLEHQCSVCDYREMTNITGFPQKTGTLEELCYILLEEIQHKKDVEVSKSHSKNKGDLSFITKKEVDDLMKFMQTASHEEFMRYIGATKYRKKPNGHKNKD